jgi:glutaminase
MGTFAPPLDTAGNSVKGQLGVNLKHWRRRRYG